MSTLQPSDWQDEPSGFVLNLNDLSDLLRLSRELIDDVIGIVDNELRLCSLDAKGTMSSENKHKVLKLDLVLSQHGLLGAKYHNNPATALEILETLHESEHINENLRLDLDNQLQYFKQFKYQVEQIFQNCQNKFVDDDLIISLRGFSAWSDVLQKRLLAIAKAYLYNTKLSEIVNCLDHYHPFNINTHNAFIQYLHNVINLESRYGEYLFTLFYNKCETEFTLENLHCISAIYLFEKIQDATSKTIAFDEIYHQFLHTGAKSWVSLSDDTRQQLDTEYRHYLSGERQVHPCLDNAYNEVYQILVVETFAKLKAEIL